MDEEANAAIGVLLMVALTVVLAAVVFVLVSNLSTAEEEVPWCEDGTIRWTGESQYDDGKTMKEYECQDRRGAAMDVKWAESEKDLNSDP